MTGRAGRVGVVALAASVLIATATGGCSTILGIGDLEAGPEDASTDKTTAPDRDATAPRRDARTELDGDARAAPDGKCHAVSADPAAPTDAAACGPLDAGACSPGNVSASSLKFVSSPLPQSVCTAKEVTDFYTDCFNAAGDASKTACDDFHFDASTAPCFHCIVSYADASASTYGPFVDYPAWGTGYFNTGACIAALDPCNMPCAVVTQLFEQCLFAACSACTIPDQGSACTAKAGNCPCGAYAAAANACSSALTEAGSPAAEAGCFSSNFETSLIAAARALCSGP